MFSYTGQNMGHQTDGVTTMVHREPASRLLNIAKEPVFYYRTAP